MKVKRAVVRELVDALRVHTTLGATHIPEVEPSTNCWRCQAFKDGYKALTEDEE
jgi:hypothetical protein